MPPPRYTPNEITKRGITMNSQKILGNFLDKYTINKLVNLFDENNKLEDNITKYIENERASNGLNNNNVEIKSKVYGTNKNKTSLILKIFKNGIQYIHLTIHLVSDSLNPANSGIIHIKKNIFKVSQSKQYKLYTLISIKQSTPKSLEFSLANGLNTPPNVLNSTKYDPELKKEMKVIIDVLNKLFDENNPLYVGKKENSYPVYLGINNVLNNINKHSKYTIRKNKGTTIFSFINNNELKINYKNHKRATQRKVIQDKTTKQKTRRKLH